MCSCSNRSTTCLSPQRQSKSCGAPGRSRKSGACDTVISASGFRLHCWAGLPRGSQIDCTNALEENENEISRDRRRMNNRQKAARLRKRIGTSAPALEFYHFDFVGSLFVSV